MEFTQLALDVARMLHLPIEDDELERALTELADLQQIRRESDGRRISRSEPDFPERRLEDPVMDYLFSDACYSVLRIQKENAVARRTARGGRYGSGQWSRPDFTVAAINRWLFDPQRTLEVFAFELKNRAGATLTAVHEGLAHTRFAHYGYVVCPRSLVRPQSTEYLLNECAKRGVGLITFVLGVTRTQNSLEPLLTDVRFDLMATRMAPDPHDVQQYLKDRFNEESRKKLQTIAGTT